MPWGSAGGGSQNQTFAVTCSKVFAKKQPESWIKSTVFYHVDRKNNNIAMILQGGSSVQGVVCNICLDFQLSRVKVGLSIQGISMYFTATL